MSNKHAALTVAIPVGPRPSHSRWLKDAIESVLDNDLLPDQIILIDDQAGLRRNDYFKNFPSAGVGLYIWSTPWLSGVAHAFNFGVALGRSPLVLMMGSDDLLRSTCISDIMATYEKVGDSLGYYHLDVEYMSNGVQQSVPCNAAAVTKSLWKLTGGFPPESAVGAPDTVFLSGMYGSKQLRRHIHRVESQSPPYLYRDHPETETIHTGGNFPGAVDVVRNYYTELWAAANWTE